MWLIVRPFIMEIAVNKSLRNQLMMFKRDKDIFTFKLSRQAKYDDCENISQNIFKTENSENKLVMVSNPYCTPCSEIYGRIHKLQKYFIQKLDISIIYAVPNNDKDLRYKAALYLLSTFQEYDLQKANEINRLWYETTKKNIGNLEREYPVKNKETAKLLLDKHIEWCLNNRVDYTPILIFNGHLLPIEYDIKDLIYFIN